MIYMSDNQHLQHIYLPNLRIVVKQHKIEVDGFDICSFHFNCGVTPLFQLLGNTEGKNESL